MPHSSRSSRTAGPLRALLIAALVGVIIAAGLLVYRGVGGNSSADYKGQGEESVIVHVEEGEGLDGVATSLADLDVVKSTGAFTTAAMNNPVAEGLQPGYYELRKKMKASVAVAMLADPNSRVGMLQVPAGARLNDTTVVGGPGATGIYQALSEASCLRADDDGGEQKCVSAEEFKQVASDADPAAIGVPEWAINEVRGGPDPTRRLEGLVTAGNHDFDPSQSPEEIWHELISSSAQQYEQSGLLQSAEALKLSPYQLMTAASLIQHEAGAADYGKVATVILNRLAKPMPLQFDSTVNYTQTDQEVATTDDARNQDNPWNTYAHEGLPYGPIASPSMEAITAMEHPEPGDWLYFVTVSEDGATKFTSNYDEHLANQQEAVDSGVLATGR
ncbi:endolytic transglycosylase MltG [Dietzia sp.]|uniref:endolytic transglycosylase MltG n=1 Tax=Dietzia sp. TaxID=1871616 RepID=UPI002FDA72C0